MKHVRNNLQDKIYCIIKIIEVYGQLTDDAEMGGNNHGESSSCNMGVVARWICKELGRAHCHARHVTTAGVTCDQTCRSCIREKGWWGQVTGWVTGINDERVMKRGKSQVKSQMMELGERGHGTWTSQYSTHAAGYLMIVAPILTSIWPIPRCKLSPCSLLYLSMIDNLYICLVIHCTSWL